MTALAGATRVQIGPFRRLRMKKTAPRGLRMTKTAPRGLRMKKTARGGIKDHNDRASWSDTGADRSL